MMAGGARTQKKSKCALINKRAFAGDNTFLLENICSSVIDSITSSSIILYFEPEADHQTDH